MRWEELRPGDVLDWGAHGDVYMVLDVRPLDGGPLLRREGSLAVDLLCLSDWTFWPGYAATAWAKVIPTLLVRGRPRQKHRSDDGVGRE